jgi:protein TonB
MRPDASEANSPRNSRNLDPITLPQGFLADCMVDGDPNINSRAGMARGRAFGISALAQASLLILFLIVPLFAVSKLTPTSNVILLPPYGGPARRGKDAKPRETPQPPDRGHRIIPQGTVFPTRTTTKRNGAADAHDNIEPNGPIVPGVPWGMDRGDSDSIGLIQIPGFHDGPRPPQPETDKNPVSKPVEVSQGAELGKLIHRVEPVYPLIAVHSHIEGTVELRAIIGRDGAVREIQVLSGNSFLIFAAKEAVLQWRFRPTLLNGQPVEVDTFFTVTFRINH